MLNFIRKSLSLLLIFSLFFSPVAFALPTVSEENIGAGSATFKNPTPQQLIIDQTSDKLILNHPDFSILQSESLKFNQPSSSSIALNRVTGGNPSEIIGTLLANGRIFLVNPNGILFGAGCQVNVGGLVASTLDISDEDFLNGDNSYTFAGQSGAGIINKGSLSAPGGFVALLSNTISNTNTGIIAANLGSVVLSAGKAITLNLDGQGLIGVVLNDPAAQNEMGQDAAIMNTGKIIADGGKVLLTAKVLNNTFDNAINNEGIIQAKNLVEKNGAITLLADGDISVGGQIRGGDVAIESTEGNVTHQPLSEVTTEGGTFRGKAAKDYILQNGAKITTGAGVIDILANQNIYLGSNDPFTSSRYTWEYISGQRGFPLVALGYYQVKDGKLYYFPLSQGRDIGKDNLAVTDGVGYFDETSGLYVTFAQGWPVEYTFTWHTDPNFNNDGLAHVDSPLDSPQTYGWEDMVSGGDGDFNDAVFTFRSESVLGPGANLNSSSNIFLTAQNGKIQQVGGDIQAQNLVLSANNGITGTGANGGLQTTARNVSAVNYGSGDIRIENPGNAQNQGNLTVADLRGITGLNSDLPGHNGIENKALGGTIDIAAYNLTVAAPITGRGNITISAVNDILQTANGKIEILQGLGAFNNDHQKVISTSHETEEWSNNDTIEVLWDLPGRENKTFYSFTATAGGKYTQEAEAEVKTNNGDATITAGGDVRLALIDTNNGNASVTSKNGSVLDNDGGAVPDDYDVIAHNIKIKAYNDNVDHDLDLGYPQVAFSYRFDQNASSVPDTLKDPYGARLAADGDWNFTTSYQTNQDSDHWWFHLATLDNGNNFIVPKRDLGPFYIDTTAPVIFANYDPANLYGWYNHDVTVGFHATDNLSGFAPDGSLTAALASKASSGEGLGLIVTSDGIFDRAGNAAQSIQVALNVDKTAPVINAGNPSGAPGPNGTYLGDVTVPFSAMDNLSGFAPGGSLSADLDPKTTSGTGGNLYVTSDGIFDLAGNFAPGIPAGPFSTFVPAPAPTSASTPLINYERHLDEFKVYYEVLEPSRFVNFEPAAKVGFYAYHPLAQTDMSSFDQIDLDTRAFEFIENNIERKKELSPYFGLN